MPEIKYCKECRRIFQYESGPVLCSFCRKKDDEEFEKVRVFLRDFPGATMQEVSNVTGVSPSKIHRWLKEERLEVVEGSPVALNCEKCGVRIRSGRFCVECSKSLAKEMLQARNDLQHHLGRGSSAFDKNNFGLYYKHKNER
ncbi:MAG TPA: flagellar operon protein YvyF [Thermoclostridium sp.]